MKRINWYCLLCLLIGVAFSVQAKQLDNLDRVVAEQISKKSQELAHQPRVPQGVQPSSETVNPEEWLDAFEKENPQLQRQLHRLSVAYKNLLAHFKATSVGEYEETVDSWASFYTNQSIC